MHVLFIPYGRKEWLDIFIREMQSQKFICPHTSPEGVKQSMIVTSAVRILPFGIYDYVFPKEHLDAVLTSLRFHVPCAYDVNKEISIFGFKIKPIEYVKKFLGLEEKIPEFSTDMSYFWEGNQFVAIIPIGIKYDDDITNPSTALLPGWTHEGL